MGFDHEKIVVVVGDLMTLIKVTFNNTVTFNFSVTFDVTESL